MAGFDLGEFTEGPSPVRAGHLLYRDRSLRPVNQPETTRSSPFTGGAISSPLSALVPT